MNHLLLLGLLAAMLPASPRIQPAVKATLPPAIDGDLSDPVWQTAEPFGEMVQRSPEPGKPASFPTRIRLLYDDDSLYIGVHLEDPEPDKIVARITRRDRPIESDWFQVEIDSKCDRRTATFFAVNAAGVQVDGVIFDESQESTDWDGVWQAATRITPEGWTAELRIPLHLLRFPSGQDVQFGMNFFRRISRLNEQDMWQFVSPESGLRVSGFGRLEGLALEHPPAYTELRPYLAGRLGVVDAAYDAGTARPFDIGLDGRFRLGSNFMLTVTANPDFGQVEADQVVLNLTTTETYYPEKRPFFLEDTTLFRMPIFGDGGPRAELFYTRRIGQAPPDPELREGEELVRPARQPRIWGAAKLAGTTEGRFSVGLLQAITSEEAALIRLPIGGEIERLSEPLHSYSILRLNQGFGRNSELGLLATAAVAPDGGAAVTGGTNLQLELEDGAYNVTLLTHWSYLTEERFVRQDSFTRAGLERDGPLGYGGEFLLLKRDGKHWSGAIGGAFRSPNLALNDLGYLDRQDLAFTYLWVQYHDYEPSGPIGKIQINANAWAIGTTGFMNLGDGGNINGTVAFLNNMYIGANAGYQTSRCDDRETRTGGRVPLCELASELSAALFAGTNPAKVVSAAFESAWQQSERGNLFVVGIPVLLNPLPKLQLELTPRYRRSNGVLRSLDSDTETGTERFLFGLQHAEVWDVTLRSTLTLTPALSFQLYGQVFLAAVDRGEKFWGVAGPGGSIDAGALKPAPEAPDSYDFSAANLNVGAVLRFEYLPGSVAFLVYTGALERSVEVPEFRFGQTVGDLFSDPARHMLMLKLSYLWG